MRFYLAKAHWLQLKKPKYPIHRFALLRSKLLIVQDEYLLAWKMIEDPTKLSGVAASINVGELAQSFWRKLTQSLRLSFDCRDEV